VPPTLVGRCYSWTPVCRDRRSAIEAVSVLILLSAPTLITKPSSPALIAIRQAGADYALTYLDLGRPDDVDHCDIRRARRDAHAASHGRSPRRSRGSGR